MEKVAQAFAKQLENAETDEEIQKIGKETRNAILLVSKRMAPEIHSTMQSLCSVLAMEPLTGDSAFSEALSLTMSSNKEKVFRVFHESGQRLLLLASTVNDTLEARRDAQVSAEQCHEFFSKFLESDHIKAFIEEDEFDSDGLAQDFLQLQIKCNLFSASTDDADVTQDHMVKIANEFQKTCAMVIDVLSKKYVPKVLAMRRPFLDGTVTIETSDAAWQTGSQPMVKFLHKNLQELCVTGQSALLLRRLSSLPQPIVNNDTKKLFHLGAALIWAVPGR